MAVGVLAFRLCLHASGVGLTDDENFFSIRQTPQLADKVLL